MPKFNIYVGGVVKNSKQEYDEVFNIEATDENTAAIKAIQIASDKDITITCCEITSEVNTYSPYNNYDNTKPVEVNKEEKSLNQFLKRYQPYKDALKKIFPISFTKDKESDKTNTDYAPYQKDTI